MNWASVPGCKGVTGFKSSLLGGGVLQPAWNAKFLCSLALGVWEDCPLVSHLLVTEGRHWSSRDSCWDEEKQGLCFFLWAQRVKFVWVVSVLPSEEGVQWVSSDSHGPAVLILSWHNRLCARHEEPAPAQGRGVADESEINPHTKKALCRWMGFQCSSLISSLGNVSALSSNCLYLNFWSEESSSLSNWTNRVSNRLFCLWQDVPHFLCKPSARSHLFNLFSVRKI